MWISYENLEISLQPLRCKSDFVKKKSSHGSNCSLASND